MLSVFSVEAVRGRRNFGCVGLCRPELLNWFSVASGVLIVNFIRSSEPFNFQFGVLHKVNSANEDITDVSPVRDLQAGRVRVLASSRVVAVAHTA